MGKMAREMVGLRACCVGNKSENNSSGCDEDLIIKLRHAIETSEFTDEQLSSLSLSSNKDGKKSSNQQEHLKQSKKKLSSPSITDNKPVSSQQNFRSMLQFAEMEALLAQVQESNRQTNSQLAQVSEQLYSAKAEKEYYRLQCQNESPNIIPSTTTTGENSKEGDDSDDSDREVEIEDTNTATNKSTFVQMIAAYEKDIATLHEELSQERNNNSNHARNQQKTVNNHRYNTTISSFTNNTHQNTIQEQRRKRTTTPQFDNEDDDEEDNAERRELLALKEKYLPEELNTSYNNEDNDTDSTLDTANNNNTPSSPLHSELDSKTKLHDHRQRHLDAQLNRLTESIVVKEELMEQLHSSQSKYEVMRGFYEDKLAAMEKKVRSKVEEREVMKKELLSNKNDDDVVKRLQSSLDAKEKRISFLKKQQQELSNLTKVSTRNENAMQKLRQDITDTKRQKMELQRRVAAERKAHASEIKSLKRSHLFQEKETTKWKQQSRTLETDAANARRVAKSRISEITRLRGKYKEAERELRKRTLKKGALARAGVDPTLVGLRGVRSKKSRGLARGSSSQRVNKELNVDGVRRFLDDRISQVGKMESIAEKVANEWEEHLELVDRKNDMLDIGHDLTEEDLEAVDTQIKYKESQIRKLTTKLGKQSFALQKRTGRSKIGGGVVDNNIAVSFLQDKQFRSMSSGMSELSSVQETCKILFGMVVRERRRVSSLARTACNLDAKALGAKADTKTKDAAFRAHLEDERDERVAMAKQHREQIMSLMSLVKRTSGGKDEGVEVDSSINMEGVLTGSCMEALESELRELRGALDENKTFKVQQEELRTSLEAKEGECTRLQRELQHYVRASRAGVDVHASSRYSPSGKKLISPSNNSAKTPPLGKKVRKTKFGSRSNSIIEKEMKYSPSPTKKLTGSKYSLTSTGSIMDDSSDDGDDDPEWADDIMADLALIAEGEMPPSLALQHTKENGGGALTPTYSLGNESVFDRLSDPHNFTGVQKQKEKQKSSIFTRESDNAPKRNSGDGMFGKSVDLRPNPAAVGLSNSPEKDFSTSSVYDRLFDSSKFTGVQKTRFDTHKKKTTLQDELPPSSSFDGDEFMYSDSAYNVSDSSNSCGRSQTLYAVPSLGPNASSEKDLSSTVYDRPPDSSSYNNSTDVQKMMYDENKEKFQEI